MEKEPQEKQMLYRFLLCVAILVMAAMGGLVIYTENFVR